MKNKIPRLALVLAAAVALSAASAKGDEKTPGAGLQAGYRAVALPVAGNLLAYVSPGDRVDVMVTFEATLAKGEKDEVTATILQNVMVLNVSRADGVVELQLNPNEAQYAVLSLEGKKTIWIERRAEGDVDMKPMEMASFRKLFR